ITLLAAARLGAVWVGLNPRYRIREMAYVIGHARPALIVSVKGFEERDYAADLDEAIAEVGDAVRPATVFFDGDGVSPAALLAALAQGKPLAEAPDELPDVDPTAPCMLVYTSGTTGNPKGVLLSQEALIYRSTVQATTFAVKSHPVVLNFAPINHI